MTKINLKLGNIEINLESDEDLDKVSSLANGFFHELLESEILIEQAITAAEPDSAGDVHQTNKPLKPESDLIAMERGYV